MRFSHILSLLLALAITSCSKSASPPVPVVDIRPTDEFRAFTFTIGIDGLSKTDVLAAVAAFAGQHSLPTRGLTQSKVWPGETYTFGYSPCYTNVLVAVGFDYPRPEAMVDLCYDGTNDSFYDGIRLALRQSVESNFTGRVLSVRTNW